MRRSAPFVIMTLLTLAACGQREALRPETGQSMPPKPATATTTPTVQDLLKPPPIANPDRSNELLKRSEPRPDDPFDLPPSG